MSRELGACGRSAIYLFIYSFIHLYWLHWVFVAACGLSVVVVSGGYPLLRCTGFSLRWLLLLLSMGSRHAGFRSCGAWALRCVGFSSCSTRAQWLWRTGFVAPQHVGSSWTRDRTHVPCIGRRILNHWATREVQGVQFK